MQNIPPPLVQNNAISEQKSIHQSARVRISECSQLGCSYVGGASALIIDITEFPTRHANVSILDSSLIQGYDEGTRFCDDALLIDAFKLLCADRANNQCVVLSTELKNDIITP